MRKRVIYRFEQPNGNGCWYNTNGSFNNLYGKVIENVPMPYDNRPCNFRAGCFSLKDLYTWGTIEALMKMKARIIKVVSDDYKLLPRGEVIYNEQTILSKTVLRVF